MPQRRGTSEASASARVVEEEEEEEERLGEGRNKKRKGEGRTGEFGMERRRREVSSEVEADLFVVVVSLRRRFSAEFTSRERTRYSALRRYVSKDLQIFSSLLS